MKKKREITARDYAKIIEWSEEDGCFIGSAPPIIGRCCHGDNQMEVYRELCQIVEEWVEIKNSGGKPLPDPREYSGKVLLRMDPALHRFLALRAEREGKSLNTLIEKRLQETN